MKVLITLCRVSSTTEEKLFAHGIRQEPKHIYRVYCKCRGFNHANELCQGIGNGVFHKAYTSVTVSSRILKFFEEHPDVSYVITDTGRETVLVTNLEIAQEA